MYKAKHSQSLSNCALVPLEPKKIARAASIANKENKSNQAYSLIFIKSKSASSVDSQLKLFFFFCSKMAAFGLASFEERASLAEKEIARLSTAVENLEKAKEEEHKKLIAENTQVCSDLFCFSHWRFPLLSYA